MEDPTCTRWSDLLAAYAAGVVPAPDSRAELEAHAASCAACRRFLEDYVALPGIVRRATDVEIPPGIRARLDKLFGPQGSGKKEER